MTLLTLSFLGLPVSQTGISVLWCTAELIAQLVTHKNRHIRRYTGIHPGWHVGLHLGLVAGQGTVGGLTIPLKMCVPGSWNTPHCTMPEMEVVVGVLAFVLWYVFPSLCFSFFFLD